MGCIWYIGMGEGREFGVESVRCEGGGSWGWIGVVGVATIGTRTGWKVGGFSNNRDASGWMKGVVGVAPIAMSGGRLVFVQCYLKQVYSIYTILCSPLHNCKGTSKHDE